MPTPDLSFTVHYILNNQLKSRVLKLSNSFSSHSSIHIKEFIEDVIREYDLSSFGSFPCVTDNAADVIHGVELAGLAPVGCICHRYQLAIQDALEESELFKRLVNKCQGIAVKIRRSGKLQRVLYECQKEIYGSTLNIVTNVVTRWFSNYYLLERILQIADEIEAVIKAEALTFGIEFRESFVKEFTLARDEKEAISFFVRMIKLMLDRSETMSSETINTMSFCIPYFKLLIEDFEDEKKQINKSTEESTITNNTFKITTESKEFDSFIEFEESGMKTANIIEYSFNGIDSNLKDEKIQFIDILIKCLENRFIDYRNIFENENMLISTLLNPMYKADFFNADVFNKVKGIVSEMIRTEVEPSETANTRGRIIRALTTNEFDNYIAEKCIDESKSLDDIIDYWNEHRYMYPSLYRLSHKYTCYLCSSSSSERLFSIASQFYSSRRTRMLPSHLEDLCILNNWITNEGIKAFEGMTFK